MGMDTVVAVGMEEDGRVGRMWTVVIASAVPRVLLFLRLVLVVLFCVAVSVVCALSNATRQSQSQSE